MPSQPPPHSFHITVGNGRTPPRVKQRIPATNLEALVRRRVHGWLAYRAAILDIVQNHISYAAMQNRVMGGLERWLAAWAELRAHDLRNFMVSIVVRIQVPTERITIMLNPLRLMQWLSSD